MNVAWGLFWGGSRSTKPGFSGKDNAFPGARSPLPLAGVGGHMYIYCVLCFYNQLYDVYTDVCIYIYIICSVCM